MGGDAGARQIEEYYPKSIFTRRYPGPEEALEGLKSANERLDSLLSALSSEALQRARKPGGWSPGEVADHLVLANELFARCISAAGDPATKVLSMPKGWLSAEGRAISPLEEEPRRGRGNDELAADLHRSTTALLDSVRRAADERRLEDPCLVHAFFGEVTVRECIQLAAWHMVRHVRKLEQESTAAS